jgi:hypothetical protein
VDPPDLHRLRSPYACALIPFRFLEIVLGVAAAQDSSRIKFPTLLEAPSFQQGAIREVIP